MRYSFLVMHSFNLINDPTSSFYMLRLNQYALATSPSYMLLDNHLKFKLLVSHGLSSVLVSFHNMSTIYYQYQIKFLFHISDILKNYASTSVNLVISLVSIYANYFSSSLSLVFLMFYSHFSSGYNFIPC